jgi:putative acetyltransferase
MLRIIPGNLRDPRVVDLLHCHLTRARAETAPGSAHALDLAGLQAPNISLWTVWDDDKLLGTGALKQLSIDHCEIKSMYTAQFARRKGVGRTMLCHIIATARERGMSRLSLETGSWDYFQPARALYRSHGFVECAPFGHHVPDSNSTFMTLGLRNSPIWSKAISEQEQYHELACYTLAHPDPGFIHQNIVDAFAAQTATEADKPIKIAFALVGLYLCS